MCTHGMLWKNIRLMYEMLMHSEQSTPAWKVYNHSEFCFHRSFGSSFFSTARSAIDLGFCAKACRWSSSFSCRDASFCSSCRSFCSCDAIDEFLHVRQGQRSITAVQFKTLLSVYYNCDTLAADPRTDFCTINVSIGCTKYVLYLLYIIHSLIIIILGIIIIELYQYNYSNY